MTGTITHWAAGAPFAGESGDFADVTNPATGKVSGRVALASVKDAQQVIDAARTAAVAWGRTSIARRTQIVFDFRELLNARKDELAAIITAEHGKVLSDALGEIARGQEVVEFACGIAAAAQGRLLRPGFDRHRRPLELRSRSVSWASSAPSTSRRWCRCGSSRSLSPRATPSCSSRARRTRPPRCSSPSFRRRPGCRTASSTSSRATRSRSTRCCSRPTSPRSPSSARRRSRSTSTRPARRHGKRVQALGGAKNHMLVLPDADLDLAADAAVNAGLRLRRRALHGDQRRWSRSSRSPTTSSRGSPSAAHPAHRGR